jgi:hypothetical protein
MSDSFSTEIISDGWQPITIDIGKESDNLSFDLDVKDIAKDLIIPPRPNHIKILWDIYNPGEKILTGGQAARK